MGSSNSLPRGIFYPDEITEMCSELALGEFPGETAEEREVRAQDIVERRRFRKRSDVTDDMTKRSLP